MDKTEKVRFARAFEGVSMRKLAKNLDRSAATVHTQIHNHDESIQKSGYCLEYRRLKGKHELEKTNSRNVRSPKEKGR